MISRKKFGLLFILAALALTAILLRPGARQPAAVKARLQENIITVSDEIETLLQQKEIWKNAGTDSFNHQKLDVLGNKYGLNWYVAQNNQLLYWNSIATAFKEYRSDAPDTTELIKLKTGWFLLKRRNLPEAKVQVNVLLPLKYEYPIENKFLSNHLALDKELPVTIEFSATPVSQSETITDKSGKPLFYIRSIASVEKRKTDYPALAAELLLLGLLFYLVYLFNREMDKRKSYALKFLGFVGFMAVFRYITIAFSVPEELYSLELFNPQYYASTIINQSLGDLLINSIWITWLAVEIYNLPDRPIAPGYSLLFKFIPAILFVVLYAVTGMVVFLFKTLVVDSTISFEIYNILSLHNYSFHGILVIFFLLVTHYLLVRKVFNEMWYYGITKDQIVVGNVLCALAYLSVAAFTDYYHVVIFSGLWTAFYIFLFLGIHQLKRDDTFSAPRFLLLLIAYYSLLSMYLIENLYEKKERDQRLFYAHKLSNERDYIAEYSFADILDRLRNDGYVKAFFENPSIGRRDLQARINFIYLSGYFAKYDLQLFAYDQFNLPVKSPDALPYDSIKSTMATGKSVLPGNALIYATDSLLNYRYFSLVPIPLDSGKTATLGITLRPKSYNPNNVFPELLIGYNLRNQVDNSGYQYAVYFRNKLIRQKGDFPYPYQWNIPAGEEESNYRYIDVPGWEHLVLLDGSDRKVIVTIAQESLFEPVATFSYFFTIYFTLALLVLLVYRKFNEDTMSFGALFRVTPSFRIRINLAMMLMIIVSFLIIGFITISFFRRQYNALYSDRLLKKEKVVLANLEYFINTEGGAGILNSSSETLSFEVARLAELNSVDVNVYDTLGNLLLASQPLIFDKGLQAGLMDYDAWRKLKQNETPQITVSENIGGLSYLTSYAALRDKSGKQLAFVSVPYFEQTQTVDAEVSGFLVALMNVYVFLLICAAAVAFFISNSITQPLRLVGEKLKFLNLNRKNEPIAYDGKDEIGVLVSEYNKMISELEQSALMLAKNERESAWREMAKQIAHEINNPLTPMRLSIQYLQRAIDEGNPNVEQMAKKVAATLLEQVDNLSNIASAFSSFAKMPKPVNEIVNLGDLLYSVTNLFSKESNVFFENNTRNILVFADKNQMISVFNNLVKNAIQSVPDGKQPQIEVHLSVRDQQAIVAISDNGSGIPEEFYESVFVPNFTTKSSGTGLGLAICRQMVSNAGGNIWFTSKVDYGTTFFVSLPLLNHELDRATEQN